MFEKEISRLQEMMDEAKNIVFFGGAGVSTESGIPDFRSVDGLYRQTYDFPPEKILSHSFYFKNKEEFYRFYHDKMLITDVEPNAAHRKLAELERAGKLTAVVTQNIDGLHQRAGSSRVLELHGSIHRNYCEKCGKFFDAEYMKAAPGVPRCNACGGDIKPDVVLYEEGLDSRILREAMEAVAGADMLIVGGTSLVVYPAAGLIDLYRGRKLVLINRDETPADARADLVIHGSIGDVLSRIAVR